MLNFFLLALFSFLSFANEIPVSPTNKVVGGTPLTAEKTVDTADKGKEGKEEIQKKCTLNLSSIQSPLLEILKDWSQIQRPIQDVVAKTLIHRGILKTGESVEFIAGGCDQFSYSITVSGVSLRSKRGKDSWKEIQAIVQRVPMNPQERKILLGGIKPLRASPDSKVLFPCGRANCSFEVLEKNLLRFSYVLPQ